MIRLLAKLIERVHPSAAQPDSHVFAFLRGVALGALVGAAIAGSSIWKRNRDAKREDHAGGDARGD